MLLKRLIPLGLLLAFIGIACNLSAVFSPSANEPSPIPTDTAEQAIIPQASDTPSPAVPTPTTEPELEAIFISRPNSGSQVTSPVTVQGEADSTFEQNLVITITGEDGAQLALSPTTIQSPLGTRGAFSLEMAFAVASVQPGRISVYSTSALDGGIVHLATVDVTLLPNGSAQIGQAPPALESIAILSPAPVAEISGGSIQVSGFSEYYFESSLGMVLCGMGGTGAPNELCGTEDNILASIPVTIQSPDIGLPGPFNAQLAYSVSTTTPARLVLYAASPRDGGLLHVNSIPLQLQP